MLTRPLLEAFIQAFGAKVQRKSLLAILAVAIVLCAAATTVWLQPPLRQRVGQLYSRGWHEIRGDAAEMAVQAGGPEASPPSADSVGQAQSTSDPLAAIDQRTSLLEEKVLAEEKVLSQTASEQAALRDRFQQALAEVTKTNALLEKQQEEWKQLLAKQASLAPAAGAGTVPVDGSDPAGTATNSKKVSASSLQGRKINLNSASESELLSLPGIGPVYAARILTYRRDKGPFRSVDELANVQGIKAHLLAKLRDLVEV